ncbi:MAG: ATP-binding protein [Bifidobacteriaceae bacterium]|jgi:predicted AAA+ superfamily ATPase|nr:ATP-binding protein [Bifidobacteriaceae bacterium]
MNRNALADLRRWKTSRNRKPLLVRGVRQVGKSWLVEEFARRDFERVVTVNFDESAAARQVFAQDLDVRRLLEALALLDGHGPIDPSNTLLFLDEIQGCPEALASLKYFAERAPEYAVIGAGSLLGVALHRGESFPVGKVEFLDLYPLTFAEFLGARGRSDLAEAMLRDAAATVPLHTVYTDHLRWYYYVGGMPEAVNVFLATADAGAVRRVQRQILDGYEQDFSKHVPPAQVPHLRDVFASLPAQLARENKKFLYGLVRSGARARTYDAALLWLADAGLVHRVRRVTAPRLPLRAYEDRQAFKLFGCDVGLLGAQSGLDAPVLALGNAAFTEFKGALTEQYVLQELVARGGLDPHYWSSGTGQAEVDFTITVGAAVIPVEVKAETNLKSKSLRVYREKFAPESALRTSLAPYRDEGWLINLPLYGIGALPGVLTEL